MIIISILFFGFAIYTYKDSIIYTNEPKNIELKEEIEKDNIMSRNSYKNAIAKKAGQEIIYNEYNDFDSDGKCEMFAVVGSIVDDIMINGEIWFASQQDIYKVEGNNYYLKYPNVYLLKDDKFMAFEEYYPAGSIIHLWGVKDGKPFQPSLTSKANGFQINKYNEIVLINSTYDAAKIIPNDWKVLPDDEIWSGHTYNQYYYYWDGENFREYGALEIKLY